MNINIKGPNVLRLCNNNTKPREGGLKLLLDNVKCCVTRPNHFLHIGRNRHDLIELSSVLVLICGRPEEITHWVNALPSLQILLGVGNKTVGDALQRLVELRCIGLLAHLRRVVWGEGLLATGKEGIKRITRKQGA